MGLKEQRKHDKKRKARDAKRKEQRLQGVPLAYEGEKYHADFWAPYFYLIESAIHDCIQESKHTITSVHIRTAIVRLIEKLRKGEGVLMASTEPEVSFRAGEEVAFLMYEIRLAWQRIFDELEPVSLTDLTGLHRSLLASIDRQNNIAAGAPGYVRFLLNFISQIRPE